jgi:hypothetical protein
MHVDKSKETFCYWEIDDSIMDRSTLLPQSPASKMTAAGYDRWKELMTGWLILNNVPFEQGITG